MPFAIIVLYYTRSKSLALNFFDQSQETKTMNTQTSLVAEQIRLQQWADQIRDCQNCPSDMKVDAWCREHDLTKANYYYCLGRIRSTFTQCVCD